MIVAKLFMVSFFKTSAPEKCVQRKINKQDREVVPFVCDGKASEIDLFTNGSGSGKVEDVFCIDNRVSKLTGGGSGSGYLFSGKVEIHKVKSTHSMDGGILKGGLQIIIKNYAGEMVGTVEYDYLFCNGTKCIDLSTASNKVIKTIHQLHEEKYQVYVNYEGDEKIAMRMELCPGDEDILNQHLREYEENVHYVKKM